MPKTSKSWAAQSAETPLAPFSFERRDPLPDDVALDIQYCGVCHTDLHMSRNDWGFSMFPMVPGHEIVGRVSAVGKNVTRFKPGDLAAVGCLVDSCRGCAACQSGAQQYCAGMVMTYGSPDKHSGGPTFGGYSDSIVVDDAFMLKLSDKLDLAASAPLLCAGITLYSPLRRQGAGPGKRVGIVGLGGLGHMGVKLARAMGAEVILFTTSPAKREDGLRLGAHQVVVSRNADEMAKHAGSLDLVLDTVAAEHDLNQYIGLLKPHGTMVLLGVPPMPLPVSALGLIFVGRSLTGSLIGGLPETQEMLDFCAKHGITSDIELIAIQQINEAYDRLLKSDVRYRFVIDMASLKG